MRHSGFNLPQAVLIFDRYKTLVSIARSIRSASLMTTYTPDVISLACVGKVIMYRKFYFRYIPYNVEIEISDLGKLKLDEYDRICGVDAKYYTIKEIKRMNKRRTVRLQNKNSIYE